MAATKTILLAVRILALIFLIVAIVCVALGQWACFKTEPGAGIPDRDENGRDIKVENGCVWNWPLGRWNDLNYHLQQVRYQYAPFIFTLVTFVIILALIIGGSVMNVVPKLVLMILAGIGAALMLICFCLEAWYTTGAGRHVAFVWFYVQSWLAATVFLFFTMVLLIVDIVVTSRT